MNQTTTSRPSFTARVARLLTESFPERRDRLAFVGLVLQLGLVVAAIHVFRIEADAGFLRLTPLILAGFVLHAFLPRRLQLPFFLLLSLLGIGVVLGPKQAAGLVGLGLGLLGICHLPIAFAARVGLLLAAGGALAVIRAEWLLTPWAFLPTLVLPILGAMFMFRLAIYLYDLRHEQKPASIWERLSYFFMLPNVCFLLFPVIDFQTFRRTYFNENALAIYRKGLSWIYRGVLQLLLYRIVYQFWLPSSAEVQSLGGVVQWMLATYLLYLRISGQFHLIIGILCLFGFNLPETHHLYYLASSFTDYWRRINIYWKDFMMKLFYYPSFMKLRKWGVVPALIASTVIVFAGTWLLHSYQWFWLQGTFPITVTDGLFWAILGALVVVNTVAEVKRGRKRTLGGTSWSLRDAVVHAFQVLGMFAGLTLLWSLWSSPSVASWWATVSQARNPDGAGIVLLVAFLLVAGGVAFQYAASRGWTLADNGQPTRVRTALSVLTMAGLLILGQPGIQERLTQPTSDFITAVQFERLNEQDAAHMERGYYEGLLQADKITSARTLSRAERPKDWIGFQQSEVAVRTTDLLEYEIRPSYEGTFLKASFASNQWGMRDKAYTQEKPAGMRRIALLGSSYEMGSGVSNEEIYEALLEDRLNQNHAGDSGIRYEVLNFAVNGYGIVQEIIVAERKVAAFQPDILLLPGGSAEPRRLLDHLRRVVNKGTEVPYPELQAILERTGATAAMPSEEIDRRLKPVLEDVFRWGYRHLARYCAEHGIRPVWVFIPRTDEIQRVNDRPFVDRLAAMAEEAGFTVLSLEGAFQGRTQVELMVAPWDGHPNRLGHQLISDRLYEALLDAGILETAAPPAAPVSASIQTTR